MRCAGGKRGDLATRPTYVSRARCSADYQSIKELLFRYVGSVGDSIGSLAVKSDAWHHRSYAITSAIAFVGISIRLDAGGPQKPTCQS
jgi:hypothetical protein